MKIRSVKYNFIMKSIMMAMSVIVPLIVYPYVCRTILPEGLGKVNFAQNNVLYFSMLAQLGIPMYGVRACAQVRDDRELLSRTVCEILTINVIMMVVSYLLFAVCLLLIPQWRAERLLFLTMAASILLNTIGMDWLYSGLEQYGFMALWSVIFNLLMIAGVFLFVKTPKDYVAYGAVYVLGTLGSRIPYFLHLRSLVSLHPSGKLNLKKHWTAVGIFFAMAVATTIYTSMDAVMLGFMRGTLENGYYDAAVKVKMVLVAVVTSLGVVILPRASYVLEKGEKEEFLGISAKALNFIADIALPMCAFFILFARPSILLLSGPAYEKSILPMQIIMPTLVFIGLTNVTGIQMMIPMGKEKQVLVSEIAGAVVNVIINAVLIPKMGAAGAAIGTVAAELTVLFVQICALRAIISDMIQKIQWWKIVLATGIACLASGWVRNLQIGSFLSLLLGAVCYFGVYVLMLILTRENLTLSFTAKAK